VFQILWQFDVTDEQTPAFTEAYGPAGPWAVFFGRAEGYRGTELYRRTGAPPRFLTLDRWITREAYQAFRRDHATDYSALDAACDGLTLGETFLAAWES